MDRVIIGFQDKLTCPVSGSSGFNSKGGFLLNLKKLRNPTGTYVCTANYKQTVRIAEYHVMREDEKPKPVSPMDPPPTFVPKPGKEVHESSMYNMRVLRIWTSF